jgi:hypothetical protein
METILVELVRSATETYRRVLLFTAHGGNAMPVDRAVRRLRADRRDVLAWSPAGAWSGDAHAGVVETSVMRAIAEDTVDMTRAVVGNTGPLGELMPEMARAGVAAVSPNGVLGDPTDATAEFGHDLLARGRGTRDVHPRVAAAGPSPLGRVALVTGGAGSAPPPSPNSTPPAGQSSPSILLRTTRSHLTRWEQLRSSTVSSPTAATRSLSALRSLIFPQ